METSQTEQTLALARTMGVLRPRDLQARGLPPEYLHRLYRRGLLERSARGLYRLPDAELTEHHTLVEACKRVPHGVACLLTALKFHTLTTQWPFEVWLALDGKARAPQAHDLPLRTMRFSGQALSFGIEEHWIEGVLVHVYTPAKTVADCFKYRHKIGLDVALEALRETWHERRATMDEIYEAARVCRVERVMQPYLEALAA
jgi:predicted transcriptional regulator of viral defense system